MTTPDPDGVLIILSYHIELRLHTHPTNETVTGSLIEDRHLQRFVHIPTGYMPRIGDAVNLPHGMTDISDCKVKRIDHRFNTSGELTEIAIFLTPVIVEARTEYMVEHGLYDILTSAKNNGWYDELEYDKLLASIGRN